MAKPVDTQALLWLRALRTEMKLISKNLDYCIQGQENGRLKQREFDDFAARISRFAKKVIISTEGAYPGD